MRKNDFLLLSLRAAGIKRLKYVFCKSGMHILSWPTYKTKRRLSQWKSTAEQAAQLSGLVWSTWIAIKTAVPELIGVGDASIVVVFNTQNLRIHVYRAHQKEAPSVYGCLIYGRPVIWNFSRLKSAVATLTVSEKTK